MSESLASSVTKTLAFNDYTVSAVALLYYDWVLTIGDEVEFIWSLRWTWGKWLYILNRYVPMLDLLILSISYSDVTLNLSLCKPWWHIDTWLSIFNFVIMDIVLLLRTWALWNRRRRVLVALIFVLAICTLATGGAALWASLNVIYTFGTEKVHPCSSDFPQVRPLYGIWAGLMVYDFFVLAMILVKAVPIFLAMPLSPTLKVFFHDGFLYYLIIFAASLANILMITFAPPELATMLFTFHRSASSLLGSRMILNLRGTLMRPSRLAQLEPQSGIRFNHNTTTLVEHPERTVSDSFIEMGNIKKGGVRIDVEVETRKEWR